MRLLLDESRPWPADKGMEYQQIWLRFQYSFSSCLHVAIELRIWRVQCRQSWQRLLSYLRECFAKLPPDRHCIVAVADQSNRVDQLASTAIVMLPETAPSLSCAPIQ